MRSIIWSVGSVPLLMVGLAACSSQPLTDNPYGLANYQDPNNWLVAYHQTQTSVDDGSSTCKVNRFYIPDAVSATWRGPCVDGFAIGKGELSWIDAAGQQGYLSSCLQPDHYRSECLKGGGFAAR